MQIIKARMGILLLILHTIRLTILTPLSTPSSHNKISFIAAGIHGSVTSVSSTYLAWFGHTYTRTSAEISPSSPTQAGHNTLAREGIHYKLLHRIGYRSLRMPSKGHMHQGIHCYTRSSSIRTDRPSSTQWDRPLFWGRRTSRTTAG